MSLFPPEMPRPASDYDDGDFWKSCAEQVLRFQACGSCGALRHPPTPICHVCHSVAVRWVDAPTQGEVYTYSVVHHASHPAVAANLPYVGAVIVFPDLPEVRLLSNIVDMPHQDVTIGMAVRLQWDDIGEGMFIPRFAKMG